MRHRHDRSHSRERQEDVGMEKIPLMRVSGDAKRRAGACAPMNKWASNESMVSCIMTLIDSFSTCFSLFFFFHGFRLTNTRCPSLGDTRLFCIENLCPTISRQRARHFPVNFSSEGKELFKKELLLKQQSQVRNLDFVVWDRSKLAILVTFNLALRVYMLRCQIRQRC